MKLCVFTVMLPDLTPEEAAPALAEAGYHGVEWRVTTVPPARRSEPPSFWGNNLCTLSPTEDDARRARALAEAAGLAIPNLGTYIDVGDLPAVETAMRFAQIAGAPQVRVGVSRTGDGAFREGFAVTRAFLADVARLARQYGVRALVETHQGTIAASASAAFRLVEGFDPASVGVIYDPGNMVYEGFEAYAMGLELLGPYLAHVHIKNGAFDRPEGGGVWQARWAPLEDGVVDFDALFAALKAVGYDGWLGVEDFSRARPSRAALRANLAMLRGVMARASPPQPPLLWSG
ncbi:MAG: sugar phosphate isomerase/epimerase [Anaerolineae bacterium]|nr:sugar phosphate isomerase/epimerase [Anaerolineae bacterium]